jgi:N-methylhydantoinase B
MANLPIETVESSQPLMIERYALVPDSGGPGKYRGGLGIVRDYRLLADEAVFQLRSDRSDFPPWGIDGGHSGTPTQNLLNPDQENRTLPGKTLMTLKKGDLYRLIQAGGGGFGNPLDRDPAAVARDVAEEKLTIEYVREKYGVVINPESLEVDADETATLRNEMKESMERSAAG